MPLNLGFYLRPQVTPFVILFIERDGSTYLVSMLQSHPQVNCLYERLAVMRQKGAGGQEQLQWASGFFTPPLVGRHAAGGFKTKLVDVLDLEGFGRLLREKRVRILHMRRRNRIKAVVSRINARRLYEATGNWNLYNESDRRPPMLVNPEEFRVFLREREEADGQLEEFVHRLGLPHLMVCYEDLLLKRDSILQEVLAFLGAPLRPLAEKTMKHTSDDLRDVVLNYDELRANFAGTSYEAMFEEGLALPAR